MAAQLTYSAESRSSHDQKNETRGGAWPAVIRLSSIRQNNGWPSCDLAPGRYTIGSGTDCDIVLSEPGVALRHCTLMVGERQTVVKAWSPLTWINDGVVHESLLRHSDRLIIGPIEVKVSRLNPVDSMGHQSSGGTIAVRNASRALHSAHLPPPADFSVPVQSTVRKDQIDELLGEIQRSLTEVIEREHIIRDSLHREKQVLTQRSDEMSQQWKMLEAAKARTSIATADPNANALSQLEQHRKELQQTKSQLDERYSELAERASAVVRLHRAVKVRIQHQQSDQVAIEIRKSQLDAQDASLRGLIARNLAQQRQLNTRSAEIERREEGLRLQQAEAQALIAKFGTRTQQLEEAYEQRNQKCRSRERFIDELESNVTARSREVEANEQRLKGLGDQLTDNQLQLKSLLAFQEERQQELDALASNLESTRRQIDTERSSLVADRNRYDLDCASVQVIQQALALEQKRHSELMDQLAAQRRENESIEQRFEQREGELQKQEESLAERQDSIGKQLQELTHSRETFHREQKSLALLTQDLAQRESSLSLQLSEFTEQRRHAASVADQDQQRALLLSRQQNDVRQQSEQHTARQAQLDADEQYLTNLQDSLTRDRAQLSEHSVVLERNRDALELERKELQSLHAARLLEIQTEFDAVRSELNFQQSQLQEREQALLTREQNANTYSLAEIQNERHDELARREAELEVRAAELAHREAELTAAQAEASDTPATSIDDEEFHKLHQELASTAEDLQRQQDAIDSRQADLDADFQNIARLRTELEAERSRDAYEREQLQHQRISLEHAEAAIAQARLELAEHKTQIENEQEAALFAARSTEAEALQQSQDLREEQLILACRELAAARQENGELQKQLSENSTVSDQREVQLQIATEQLQIERERLRILQEGLELRQNALEEEDLKLIARTDELERRWAQLERMQEDSTLHPNLENIPEIDTEVSPAPQSTSLLDLFKTNSKAEMPAPVEPEFIAAEEITEPAPTSEQDAAALKLRNELAALFGFGLTPAVPYDREAQSPGHSDESIHEIKEHSADAESPPSDETESEDSTHAESNASIPAPENSDSEEEESVDSYMRRLLARTRGTTANSMQEPVVSKPAPVMEASHPATVATRELPPVEGAPAPLTKVRKMEPGEKESIRADLDSFRELANYSARTAVATSKVSRTSALLKSMAGLAGLGWITTLALLTTPFWLGGDFFLETMAVVAVTSLMTILAAARFWEIKQMAAVPAPQREQLCLDLTEETSKSAATDHEPKNPLSFL